MKCQLSSKTTSNFFPLGKREVFRARLFRDTGSGKRRMYALGNRYSFQVPNKKLPFMGESCMEYIEKPFLLCF
jgi:hypothetical protein